MMRERWNQLSERDQWALSIGGIVLAVFLFYQLIYSPLSNAVQTQSQLLQEQTATLQWMQSVRGQFHRQSSNQQTLGPGRLLGVIDRELARSEFKNFPFQLQQGNDAEIRLLFDQVPAVPFIQWLRKMQQSYGFAIKTLQLDKLEKSGTIKVSLVIEPVQ